MHKLTKKRAELLAELEYLIGSNCYNGNIQNYGAGGCVIMAKGAAIRYPLMTTLDAEGEKAERPAMAAPPTDDPRGPVKTGYYAFGANQGCIS